MQPKTKGRPKGSPNKAYTLANAAPSRCRCGSTRRERYFSTRTERIDGRDAAGRPFTHVVWRRTRCADCGQFRVDRSYENWPEGQPENLDDQAPQTADASEQ